MVASVVADDMLSEKGRKGGSATNNDKSGENKKERNTHKTPLLERSRVK